MALGGTASLSVPRRLPGRRWRLAAVALALASGVVIALLGWSFSSRVIVPDHSGGPYEIDVIDVGPRLVTLERTHDSTQPGTYKLEWNSGNAIVGAVLNARGDSVTRRYGRARGAPLEPGDAVNLRGDVWEGNPRETIGVPYRSVQVRGELGPMPAWLVPGRRPGRWAILVHGINGRREQGLRVVPALRRMGFNSLLITYRNDPGAPAAPDGKHHMGLTEWRDLEAAIRLAVRRGATEVILAGWSMGGAIVSQLMRRSHLSEAVSGLLLDAPALDWAEILRFNAEQMGLPSIASLPVRWAIDLRIDPDWGALDVAADPAGLDVPILLVHGTGDRLVPISSSDELAARLPGLVTYYRIGGAGHTEAWNVDPRAYEGHLRRFVKGVVREARRPGTQSPSMKKAALPGGP